ncbi:MAG: copper resistance protein CopC [Actinobacteria bacterium]|nr:copper resistance protein CopC [Actinomycetota bacterium]
MQEDFQETRALHCVGSQPANNALLSTAPRQVVLTFTKELIPPSEIEVTCEGSDVTTAPTSSISEDRLSLSVPIDAARTGNYQVEYSVTWTDGMSDTGSFGFSVQLQ